MRGPRGTGSCFQLVNAPWGSRCKAVLNMLIDISSTMWAVDTRQQRNCYLGLITTIITITITITVTITVTVTMSLSIRLLAYVDRVPL